MSLRRVAIVLGLLEMFGPISMDLYMPALPELADQLHTSQSLAQATMSACMLGLALGQLVVGPLSDRLGRRRPLLVGVGLFAVLSVVCAITPNIELLLAARFFQGLSGSAGIVVCLAVARDLTEGAELVRLLAMLTTVGAIAPIVAPVVGGQLAPLIGWRGIFAVLAGVGVLLFVLAWLLLPESLPPESRRATGSGAGEFGVVLKDRLFLGFLVAGAFGGIAFFTYLASISFVLQDSYGLSPQAFSVCFAANAVMSVVGAQINRAVVRRAGPARMYTIGTVTTALAALAMLVSVVFDAGLAALLVALALMMMVGGGAQSNGSALALADHGARAGTAAALLGTTSFAVGPIVAPLVSLGGTSPLTMSLTMAVAYGGAAALVVFVVLPRLRKRPVEPEKVAVGAAEVVPPGAL
ncbi:multidrug effflux MFS transporter [Actinokineospora enzanensis]|uniref:multidrug effflux MFS transporter n=1 Tax=Actinokineospora enzanensis TaxID=155975 RepID=UPI00036A4E02|nr:multidrug effflux MFS transporter [Actinokineospora enzanensis]